MLTRVLADDSVVEVVRSYFSVPDEMSRDPVLARVFVEQRPEWVCWQTGLELRYMDATLFSMKQVMPKSGDCGYSTAKLLLNQDDGWCRVDAAASSILEVALPQDTVVIKRPVRGGDADAAIGYQASVLDANPRSVCQLLALAVEHIDTLLEDWYPSLGTRFLHTSEGKMLVTRLVPCPRCLAAHRQARSSQGEIKSWQDWSFLPPGVPRPDQASAAPKEHHPIRVSQDSCSDRDSGVESPRGSQQNRKVSEKPQVDEVEEATEKEDRDEDKVYCFLVEECVLSAFRGAHPTCPTHGDLVLGQVAPDVVFLDLEDRLRVSGDAVKLGELVGRGAFGFVYEAALRQPAHNRMGQQQHPYQSGQQQQQQQQQRSVAVKMLQPIDPGSEAGTSASAAFKVCSKCHFG